MSKQWAEKLIMGKALEPESPSLAADGWRDAVTSAYQSISRRLGMTAVKPKGEELDALAVN